jgi:hypothetical protein
MLIFRKLMTESRGVSVSFFEMGKPQPQVFEFLLSSNKILHDVIRTKPGSS